MASPRHQRGEVLPCVRKKHIMLRKAQAFFTVALLAVSLTASARIALGGSLATEVDLLLVLATDVSNSVDEAGFQFQRKGYVAAITSPFVIEAIQSGPLRRIAVCYIEWSGVDEQKLVVRLDRDRGRGERQQIYSGARYETARVQWPDISRYGD